MSFEDVVKDTSFAGGDGKFVGMEFDPNCFNFHFFQKIYRIWAFHIAAHISNCLKKKKDRMKKIIV